MPLGLDLVQSGDDALRSVWAHTLSFGTIQFLAMVQPSDPLDPEMPQGADPREVADIHIRREDVPTQLTVGSLLVQEDGARWRVWRRSDNPTDFNVTFRATRHTAKDQA